MKKQGFVVLFVGGTTLALLHLWLAFTLSESLWSYPSPAAHRKVREELEKQEAEASLENRELWTTVEELDFGNWSYYKGNRLQEVWRLRSWKFGTLCSGNNQELLVIDPPVSPPSIQGLATNSTYSTRLPPCPIPGFGQRNGLSNMLRQMGIGSKLALGPKEPCSEPWLVDERLHVNRVSRVPVRHLTQEEWTQFRETHSVRFVPGLSILMPHFFANLYGHLQVDNIFPIISLLTYHNLWSKDIDFNVFTILKSNQPWTGTDEELRKGNALVRAIFGPNKPPVVFKEIVPGLCFEKALLGTLGMHGINPPPRGPLLPPPPEGGIVSRYREWFYYHLDLPSPLPLPSTPAANRKCLTKILLMDRRTANRRIWKPERHLQMLQETYTVQDGFNVSLVFFEDISVKEQLKLLSDTFLLIGVSGTGSHNILYMPDHSASIEIIPNTHMRVNDVICSNLADHLCQDFTFNTYYNETSKEHFVDPVDRVSEGCCAHILSVFDTKVLIPLIDKALAWRYAT